MIQKKINKIRAILVEFRNYFNFEYLTYKEK